VILGLGIDLLENSRMERELSRGQWAPADGVFTEEEIRYCAARMPAFRYAACFAAKEAALKALGVPVADLAIYREVEIRPGNGSGRQIVLHRRLKARSEQLGVRNITLSVARSPEETSAIVIIES